MALPPKWFTSDSIARSGSIPSSLCFVRHEHGDRGRLANISLAAAYPRHKTWRLSRARRSFASDWIFWFLPHETYLITVKSNHVVDLATYARKVLSELAPEDRRARVLGLTTALAQLVRSLHERSLSHRDLKASNILIDFDSLDGRQRLSLIDLVGVRLRHPLPWSRRVQNLAHLCISLDAVAGRTRTDSLRFLRHYLPWGLSPLNDWKGIWRSIERGIRNKRSRNRRRGRPLS